CGGDRSSRLRENAEGARNAPVDKSLKTPARETRNGRNGIISPNECRVEKVLISNSGRCHNSLCESAAARSASSQALARNRQR
ncbi:MAG: hypothetical protein JSV60_07740, partial [Desulfobacterales bacterium]